MSSHKSFLLQVLLQVLLALEVLNGTVHAAGKKYALVIGVQNYDPTQLTSLQHSEADAVAIGESLEKLGFDVIVMTRQASIPERVPATADDILTQIQRRIRDRDPDDTIVIMLSGHGVQLKSDPVKPDGTRESYFCPERTNLNDRSTLLSLSQVVSVFQECKAGRKLLLVDACRNEVEPKAVTDKGGSPVTIELDPAGVTRRTIPQGMVALFSCSPKERSFEMSGLSHSVFSYHVLQYLDGKADNNRYPDGELRINEMATFVSHATRDYIDQYLGKDQTPELLLPSGRLTDWPLGKVGESPKVITNSIGMKLKSIPAGEFLMGSPADEAGHLDNEGPQHQVRITKPLLIGVYEVTRGQFRSFAMDQNYTTEAERGNGGFGWNEATGEFEGPSERYNWRNVGFAQTDEHPVVNVSWNDALSFCNWLSRKDNRKYRLPKEAEWEYACRAGSTHAYQDGVDEAGLSRIANLSDATAKETFVKYPNFDYSNSRDGFAFTSPIGALKPNAFGLYDMYGNVTEWCQDVYDEAA
jgi:formylglycine-generating enzyme